MERTAGPDNNSIFRGRNIYYVAALLLLAAGVYAVALFNGLVNWDDTIYISENPLLKSFSATNLKHIFSQSFDGHYSPLTLLSLMFDYLLSDNTPWFFHLASTILHLINILLVLKLVHLLTADFRIAWITALLFAVHPLNVEAVAWASGRKDVLFSAFFLAALISYQQYSISGKKLAYFFSLCFFLLSCLAKEQAVSLAVLLFAFDYFNKRNISTLRHIAEKLPFFVFAVVFGLLAIWAQKETGYLKPLSGEAVSVMKRLVLGSWGILMYLYKIVLPANLNAYYSYPFDVRLPLPYTFSLVPLLIPVVAFVFIRFRKIPRIVIFGFSFFFISIFLMLRFLQANPGDFIIAERYMYIPAIGLFMLIAYGICKLIDNYRKYRKAAIWLTGAILIALSFLSVSRILVWKDSMTLLNDILSKNPKAYTALNCRGDIKAEAKDYKGAIDDFNKAIAINPANDRGFSNRGLARAATGDYQGALADFTQAISLDPRDRSIYNNRGLAFFMAGDNALAIADFNKAISLDKFFTEAFINRGNALLAMGDPNAAIADFSAVLRMDPGSFSALASRGMAYNKCGQFRLALADLEKALSLDGNKPTVYFQMGFAHYNLRDFKTACTDFSKAVDADVNYADALMYRGFAYYNLADYLNCIRDLDKAISLAPGNSIAYGIRGMANIRSGRREAGCSDLTVSANLGNEAVRKEIEKYCSGK